MIVDREGMTQVRGRGGSRRMTPTRRKRKCAKKKKRTKNRTMDKRDEIARK
jgi:hypothetical protein